MQFIELLLIPLVLAGHLALWVALFNRTHALAIPCRLINLLEKAIMLIAVALPMLLLWRYSLRGTWLSSSAGRGAADVVQLAYFAACGWMLLRVTTAWLRWTRRPNAAPLISNHTFAIDLRRELGTKVIGNYATRIAAAVPGNQILSLHVHEKTIQLPRLPAKLDRLTVTHLSDLHFTGHVGREMFRYVVDRANQLESDMVVITGDIVDKTHCIEWIPATLGCLEARLGVYFVLGNHDKRVRDVAVLRRTLVDNGLTDLGGRTLVVEHRRVPILLAGNELPWFGPAPEVSPHQSAPFRILLAHTPDQIAWARQRQFDLMLAGHTHGGQIRLPWIGPIVSPSRFGVRYAGGVFCESPTLMHVSRGISALHPLRLNCPPELTKLVLRAVEDTSRCCAVGDAVREQ